MIENEELRRKCVSVWKTALREHGLKEAALLKMGFAFGVSRKTVNLVNHIRAVAQTAAHLAEVYNKIYKIKVNRDTLLAGALLHDVGKLDEKKNPLLEHSLSSVLRAKDGGISEDVLHIIAFHSEATAGKRQSIEAELLYFADFAHYKPLLKAVKPKNNGKRK